MLRCLLQARQSAAVNSHCAARITQKQVSTRSSKLQHHEAAPRLSRPPQHPKHILAFHRHRMSTAMAASSSPAAAAGDFPSVVSAVWLKQHLAEVRVLDANWYMPNVTDKDALAEYCAQRVPGAQYFDLDKVADASSGLPHMLPSEQQFAAAADALGITNDDAVVIYDHSGIFSAPRAWWTWRVFGHCKVAVLDGGWPAWVAVDGPVDSTPVDPQTALQPSLAATTQNVAQPPTYKASLQAAAVRGAQQMLANVDSQREVVVDARPAARFKGEAAEPRPGLRLGHIPGKLSRNVPWDSVLTAQRTLKPAAELQKVFSEAGVDLSSGEHGLVMTCGSGTTACILVLAAAQVAPGLTAAVYDGSWSEWGALEGVPVATGAAAEIERK